MMRALLMIGLALWMATASAQSAPEAERRPGLLKRGATVDKPIPETYEPLTSTHVERGEALNESIEQSWELKKKAREQQEQALQPPAVVTPERKVLEERIEEPGAATAEPVLPQLESTEKAIRISEPEPRGGELLPPEGANSSR